MLTSESPMAWRSWERPLNRLLQLDDQLVELGVTGVDGGQHGVEVVDHVADDRVAVGDGVGQRGGPDQQLVERAALPLQGLHDLEGELVDVAAGSAPGTAA